MSVTPHVTYPGVYIQELPSAARTITGVPTSITAFIGRALRGPLDSDPLSPVLIHSWADYERMFGGLWKKSEMSYAVYHYFLNGGADALIVRVYKPLSSQQSATFSYRCGNDAQWTQALGLKLQASSPGNWGKNLAIYLDTPKIDTAGATAFTFNLTVTDTSPPPQGSTENHRNLSLDPNSPRYVKRVLQYESQLIQIKPGSPIPSSPPASTPGPFTYDGPTPPPPTADNKRIQTSMNTPVQITLTGTDQIPGDVPTFSLPPPPNFHGTLNYTPGTLPARVTYTPNTNWTGNDIFTYNAIDGCGRPSPDATVTICVDTPTADNKRVQTRKGIPVQITLTGIPAPGGVLAFSITTPPASGSGVSAGPIVGNSITYAPDPTVTGDVHFNYKSTSTPQGGGQGTDSTEAIVTVSIDKPTADNKSIQTYANTPVQITLTGSDPIPGDVLTFPAPTSPEQGGTLSQQGNKIIYTPPAPTTTVPMWTGTDNFTYTSQTTLGSVVSDPATVTIDVSADLDGVAITDQEVNGDPLSKTGYWALENADIFNLLCIPPYEYDYSSRESTDADAETLNGAEKYCQGRDDAGAQGGKHRAILLVDSPGTWKVKAEATDQGIGIDGPQFGGSSTRLDRGKNAAIFFPRLLMPDLLDNNRTREFAPCGGVAGVIAQTDSTRGVWKSPAGIDASLTDVTDVTVGLTDSENGDLNPLGINCIRVMPVVGPVVWGSRTLRGADELADQWKYLAVRRTALYIEVSLYRGIQWVVFEPNDEPLWSQIRLNVGSFMQSLFIQGAFQGQTPKDAYFVKCDNETTTQTDIDNGIVNIIVGFAPLKPAEFVILKIQQMTGQGA